MTKIGNDAGIDAIANNFAGEEETAIALTQGIKLDKDGRTAAMREVVNLTVNALDKFDEKLKLIVAKIFLGMNEFGDRYAVLNNAADVGMRCLT